MYCSSCGVTVAPGLSYCNHCGVKLPGGKSDQESRAEVKPELLVCSMVALLVLGLVAITFLMMAMKMVGLNGGQIMGLTILSFLMIMFLEGTLMWQLFRRKRGAEMTLPERRATNELDIAQARILPEGVPSVTEHTTRAFEPIYRGQQSK